MPNVRFHASRRTLTSHAGLSIIGQCFEITGVDSQAHLALLEQQRQAFAGMSVLGR